MMINFTSPPTHGPTYYFIHFRLIYIRFLLNFSYNLIIN